MDANWVDQLDAALQVLGANLKEVRKSRQTQTNDRRLEIALMHYSNAWKVVRELQDQKAEVKQAAKRIQLKLWRFSLPDEAESLYIYSLHNNEEEIRAAFAGKDHGAMNAELYRKLYTEGRIERITRPEQVPEDDFEWTPYHTWEIDNNAVCLTIEDFFDPPDQYR